MGGVYNSKEMVQNLDERAGQLQTNPRLDLVGGHSGSRIGSSSAETLFRFYLQNCNK